ncbi:MAG: UDP-N-acetylmuramate dehydrogenase [Oscillospiraceae bacterium]|nr:UDP-N-acetylmuramate dehydrogenase [Oscillospiraceae bacterium]
MTIDKSQISEFINDITRKLPNALVKLNESIKEYTTFKIGGSVSIMIFPGSTACLEEICRILSEHKIVPLVIGNGSNILADDRHLDIVVINTSKINSISIVDIEDTTSQEYCYIEVEAGALLSDIAEFACENELTGFEFAHGIPGTAGGAVVMNAGAYGGEMKDVIYSTTAYNSTEGAYTLTAADNEFSYRKSKFSDTGDIIFSAVIRLEKGDKSKIKKTMDELYVRRHKSQPLDFPSGGSTFKRPKEDCYAASLIEQAGLKGFSIGDAGISEKHTGFIINKGNATFKDVIAVIEHVQDTVFKQIGVILSPEIKIIR